jgi:hypothetical protein
MRLREFAHTEFERVALTRLAIAGNSAYAHGLWIKMLMEMPLQRW